MLRSMTAFARLEQPYDFGTLTWELRSVNHRYLDLNIRLPEDLRGLEQVVREKIGAKLKRGKVDVSLRYKLSSSAVTSIEIDEEFVKNLLAANAKLNQIASGSGEIDSLAILRWPGVIKEQERDWTPLEAAAAKQLDSVLDELLAAREREGQRIAEMLQQRCQAIAGLVTDVRKRRPDALQYIRNKVETKIADMKLQVDQNRLEQELVLIAQRMDVDEELDRLDSHLEEMNNVLSQNQPMGRRLDFLMQELNREANTLGSKAADAETTKSTVDLKVLIEQMREQIQNIE